MKEFDDIKLTEEHNLNSVKRETSTVRKTVISTSIILGVAIIVFIILFAINMVK